MSKTLNLQLQLAIFPSCLHLFSLFPLRPVLQPQTEAAHPQGPGHVRHSQWTVLLLHVQLRSRAGGRLQAAPGEQAAQS